MNPYAKMLKFLLICLSLFLIGVPSPNVYGQEVTESDGVVETGGGMEAEGETSTEVEETSSEVDLAHLSHHLFLPVIQGGSDDASDVVAAAHPLRWVLDSCSGVPNTDTDRGLWDDMPSPGGAHNEAGLLWFRTNDAGNEICSYSSYLTNSVSATSLKWRVAVNDSALFTVALLVGNPDTCAGLPSVFYTTSATADDSQYRLHSRTFSARSICRVQISLTDDPNAQSANVHRTSALIDYIQLLNAAGMLSWEEQFSN